MCINDSSENKQNGRWTKEQHQKFIYGIKLYGKNWKKIQDMIPTRTSSQIRSHAQKFFIRMQKDNVQEESNQNIQLESLSKELQETLVNQYEPKSILENANQMSFYMKKIALIIQESQIQGKELNFWNSCIEDSKVESIKKEQNEYPRLEVEEFDHFQDGESVNIFKRNSKSSFSQFEKGCSKKRKL